MMYSLQLFFLCKLGYSNVCVKIAPNTQIIKELNSTQSTTFTK